MSKRAVILIPIYKESLNPNEQISLARCFSILGHHPIVFVAPESLSFTYHEGRTTERFADSFFQSPKTYNHLLIDPAFYERFREYEFMLIYQLDAYVFSDQLEYWCAQNFDYMGAPKLKLRHYQNPGHVDIPYIHRVLFNGGFSLRKIKPIIRFLKIYHALLPKWVANEDCMFSVYERRALPLRWMLRLPTWQQGLKFAIEKNPHLGFKLNGDSLPFGCHAWEKYNPKFWQTYVT
jgi:hypothetical protein